MEKGYTADIMTEWYTGTVVQEATRASREDMWGWSSASSTHRAEIFDEHDKEAPFNNKDGDSSGAESRSVGLFLGVPLLVASLQLV
jgi:hypothetical protein